jgi:hypothetical protein
MEKHYSPKSPKYTNDFFFANVDLIKGRDASRGRIFLLLYVASKAEKFCCRPFKNLCQMMKN